jgi:4-hydroxybenzoate polyprenyltransferase
MAIDQAPAHTFRQAWDWVLAADRFVRLHQLFFSAVWPLLGAASVRRDLTIGQLSALLGVMLCFHIYTYVLNDVVDLPIDRTQPGRQSDPLVCGAIRPWQALLIAFVQPVLAIPLTMWIGGTLRALTTLAVGFALMGAYNLWGKRCPVPPLTDAIQGLAWGSLAVYAPQALGAEPNALTWMVAAYVAVFTLFFNGIHGSLRDLGNDLASGARTTAIFLGARPAPGNGDAYVPVAVAAYASSVLALLIGISAALMVRNDFGYGPIVWTGTTIAVGTLNLFTVMLHPKVVRPRGPAWDVEWRLQLYLVAISLPVAFAAHASVEVLFVLVLLNVIALVLFGYTPVVTRWAWLTIRSAIRPAYGKNLATGLPRTD